MFQSKEKGAQSGLDNVLPLLNSLRIEEKLTVLEKLLAQHSDLNVVLAAPPLPITAQIEQMSWEQMGEVIQIISRRMARGE